MYGQVMALSPKTFDLSCSVYGSLLAWKTLSKPISNTFLLEKKMAIDPQKKSKVAAKLYENLKKSGVEAGNLELIERETK